MAAMSSAPPRHDDLDNYDVDDFSDDPFGSPPRDDAATKKRKEADAGLGLDEEVSVQKRARVPNVKLDEERLLGPRGIPRLRRKARDLKFKGKGHEFSDAQRLLSFYQLWLDDLFPKAKFLDALAMVEKAGHKKALTIARNDIINEGKPKDSAGGDEEDEFADLFPESTDAAPAATSSGEPAAPKTPPRNDDIPDDEDLYDATPRRPVSLPIRNDAVPDDEDDLDALIAEAETHDQTSRPRPEPEDDDLDALIAEAETRDQPKPQPPNAEPEDVDDLDALMAEAEAQDQAPASEPVRRGGDQDFADDEAAMQEMEGLW